MRSADSVWRDELDGGGEVCLVSLPAEQEGVEDAAAQGDVREGGTAATAAAGLATLAGAVQATHLSHHEAPEGTPGRIDAEKLTHLLVRYIGRFSYLEFSRTGKVAKVGTAGVGDGGGRGTGDGHAAVGDMAAVHPAGGGVAGTEHEAGGGASREELKGEGVAAGGLAALSLALDLVLRGGDDRDNIAGGVEVAQSPRVELVTVTLST